MARDCGLIDGDAIIEHLLDMGYLVVSAELMITMFEQCRELALRDGDTERANGISAEIEQIQDREIEKLVPRTFLCIPVLLPSEIPMQIQCAHELPVFLWHDIRNGPMGRTTKIDRTPTPKGEIMTADCMCAPMTEDAYQALMRTAVLAAGGVMRDDGQFEILELTFVPATETQLKRYQETSK